MKTKDYLRQKAQLKQNFRSLNRAINQKIKESEKWRAKAEKVTSVVSDMPRGNNGENQRELAMVEMVDCDLEANRLIDQLCDLRERIKDYMLITGDNDENLLAFLAVEK